MDTAELTDEVGEVEWMKVDEVAAKLRIGRTTVYDLVHSGELPAARFGRAIRIHRDTLAQFTAKQAGA